jgi:hypothetical protein
VDDQQRGSGEGLLKRFADGGFEALVNEEPRQLAEWLENRAVETGESASLYLALAVGAVYALFREHDEHGGVRVDFVQWLDHLVKESLPNIETANAAEAARLAQRFHREITERVQGYATERDYSL